MASASTALTTNWRQETIDSHHGDVERVIVEMHRNLEEGYSLNELADIAVMTPFHFSRVFRCVTGVPPCRFMWMLRLEAAKKLLVTTERRVIDICYDVGYSSLGTFTRRFTQLVGIPPLKFRSMVTDGAMARVWSGMRHLPAAADPEARSAGLSGVTSCAGGFAGIILIGLFRSPVPYESPVCCTLMRTTGSFRLRQIPRGKFFLFAAGIRETTDSLDSILSERIIRGAARVGGAAGRDRPFPVTNRIALRSPRLVDPPLLPCLPALIQQNIGVPGSVGVPGSE